MSKCCPFQSTPGRFMGEWTNCIHGLRGRRDELIQELDKIEAQIRKLNHTHRYPLPNGQGFPVDQCLDCSEWKS